MVSPVLPPNIPIVGASAMSPSWWRWFRDLQAAVASSETDVASLTSLAALGPGVLLRDKVLTTGNNVIAHGAPSTPVGWFAMRPRGAFVSSGGGGQAIYLPHKATRQHYRRGSVGSSRVLTLNFTPADGAVLLMSTYTWENNTLSYPGIGSIAQTGVTWTKVNEATYNPTYYYALELWVGVVSAGASTTITITSNGSVDFGDYMKNHVVEFTDLTGTVITSAAGTAFGVAGTGSTQIDSDAILTTPSASAGDVCFCALGITASYPPVGSTNGWNGLSGAFGNSSSDNSVYAFSRVAQHDEAYPLLVNRSGEDDLNLIYAVMEANTLSVSGSSVTIPHGLREVSVDATNLTLESVSDVTVDLWVAY
jgi:hypothetical protein